MNKVTQSIYKQKVNDLENKVSELLNKPQLHLYTFSFTSGNYQNVMFQVHTYEELPLTVSAIYDYVFEATKYHGSNRYNLPLSGFYWDSVSQSETYGRWIACEVGAMQNYPGATVTQLAFSFVKTGDPGNIITRRISKEWLETLNNVVNKVY